jgi:hypothetical protein
VTTQPTDISAIGIDTKSLATLIIELNIARRNATAYPKGHPVIAASLTKVLRVYEELLKQHEELILGVTSDALMLDGVILEKSNLVYRDFSRVLFEHGIGALLFHRGVTIAELNNFMTLLGIKREQIFKFGGIEEVWAKAHISAISIRPIRYDLFQTTDADSILVDPVPHTEEKLWDRFARELTLGEITSGSSGSNSNSLDPEILAEILNNKYISGSINKSEIKNAISEYLTQTEVEASSKSFSQQPHKKLAAFISNLTPELRRQFLNSSFADNNKEQQNRAEGLLTNLSNSTILETLEDINQNRLNVSPVIFELLQRLGKNVSRSCDVSEKLPEDENLSQKMKTIFREHASEEFVPDRYQQKLNYIIAADQIPRLNMEEVNDLLNTVDNQTIEHSIGQILLNLIREGVETPEERDLLLQNLSDMFGFFLQTGDYTQLHKMMDQLNDNTFPIEIKYRLYDEYGRREYLDEILDGLTFWGKQRYDDIRKLIHKFGAQFIEAILDRLSEEKSMSLRRFYMDCLIDMGPVTRVPIVNRLYDTRWYFLRNLLIILSAQNDPSVIQLIHPLLHSEDQRLRHEVLKTLVHLRDPQAEKQIMDDLHSQNMELQSAAIQLAEQCKSPAVANILTGMLSHGGFSQFECERKSAIIHTLGEIGRAEILPELAKILSSRSLFHSKQLTKLKAEIIQSLSKYPPTVSRPILDHIADGSGELSRLAIETAKSIRNKK